MTSLKFEYHDLLRSNRSHVPEKITRNFYGFFNKKVIALQRLYHFSNLFGSRLILFH